MANSIPQEPVHSGRADFGERPIVSRPLFFSSTFRDMHAERDLLRDDAFLELNERLRGRRHELNVVDLRQGVETGRFKDEAERELVVLQVCLNEIDRTRPFLVGLIGDCYGWIPPAERMEAAARAAGFSADVVGRSVTELELLYAFVRDPEQRGRSRIYIRAMDYAGMPEEVRETYDERFAPRNGTADERRAAEERREKLEVLKKRLREEFPERVRTYTARWDAARGSVTGLGDLRDQVVEDLWTDLDAHTRAYEEEGPRTWQEADTLALEDFVAGRMRHFLDRPAVTGPALEFLLGPPRGDRSGPWGLCLTGASGMGKSALFARLYLDLKVRERRGELLVLAHAAGIYAGSDQVDRMLRRWVRELSAFLGVEDPLSVAGGASGQPERASSAGSSIQPEAGSAESRAGIDNERIDEVFASLLGRAAARTRVVVLLDALNQFERTNRARFLTWLPKPWPENTQLLATAISGEETLSLTRAPRRADLRIVHSITREEAHRIAWKVFEERYHREPNAAALKKLLDKQTDGGVPAHGNPLWLELALQEMNLLEADDYARAEREFTHLRRGERMEALLSSVAEELPSSVQAIYGELLDRAERTFGREFTHALIVLIAVGRNGWRESDLEALVPKVACAPWTDLAFAGVRRSLGRHLVRRGAAGLWDFFHAGLREGALARYLADPDTRCALHRHAADHLRSLPVDDPLRATETMVHVLGWGDRSGGAEYLAGLELGTAEMEGAATALAGAIETGMPTGDGSDPVEWALGCLDENYMDPVGLCLAAGLLLFQVEARLAVSGAAEKKRGQVLEGVRSRLERAVLGGTAPGFLARDLSVSLNKLGDFYLRRGESGDAGRALASYQ
ncbi:MAG: DUF4062 domain-containing protein, partial [Candidatus Eisenbacteria bacterium]|nr:DUF4062 domain-containing protein [Candidatus Eisenbacteria bacterium]